MRSPASRRPQLPPTLTPAVADTFNEGHSPSPAIYGGNTRTYGLDRGSDLSARVDSILVTPSQLTLRTGETLGLDGNRSLSWEARDSASHVVRRFRPVFTVSDSTMLRVDHGVLIALRPGTADLIASATRMESAHGHEAARGGEPVRHARATRIPVTVR